MFGVFGAFEVCCAPQYCAGDHEEEAMSIQQVLASLRLDEVAAEELPGQPRKWADCELPDELASAASTAEAEAVEDLAPVFSPESSASASAVGASEGASAESASAEGAGGEEEDEGAASGRRGGAAGGGASSSCATTGAAQSPSVRAGVDHEKAARLHKLRCFLASTGFRSVSEPRRSGRLAAIGLPGAGPAVTVTYPLHAAARANDAGAAEALLWAGSDRSRRDSQKLTALDLARKLDRSGSHAAVIRLLSS